MANRQFEDEMLESGTTRVRPRFVFPEPEWESPEADSSSDELAAMIESTLDMEATVVLEEGESKAFWSAAIATLDAPDV